MIKYESDLSIDRYIKSNFGVHPKYLALTKTANQHSFEYDNSLEMNV